MNAVRDVLTNTRTHRTWMETFYVPPVVVSPLIEMILSEVNWPTVILSEADWAARGPIHAVGEPVFARSVTDLAGSSAMAFYAPSANPQAISAVKAFPS